MVVISLTNLLYPDDKNLLAPHEELSQSQQIIPHDTIWRRRHPFLPDTTWGIIDALARDLPMEYYVPTDYLRHIHSSNCLFMRVKHMENALRIMRAKKYYIRTLPQPIAEEIEEYFDSGQYSPQCSCYHLTYFSNLHWCT